MGQESIFLSAGDPSGDNAAARLWESLVERRPGISCFGLGGGRLRDLGQEQMVDGGKLAVLGFWEVARQFRFFRSLMNQTVKAIKERRPAVIVLVDYPGFNLRLAKRIRKLGIPIIYYISPQVWAWGHRRVKEIRELVDLMLVILPFESDFYSGSGVNAHFVGHYLLEDIPAEMISSDSSPDGPLALLPGSRPQEIEKMLPPMIEAAVKFNRQYGTSAVVAGIDRSETRAIYEPVLQSVGDSNISIEFNNTRKLLERSALVVTASGTATLEAAIIGRPMVVIYRTGAITYQIARRLVKLDKIALVNLVLGEKVVPELIQRQANPEAILKELKKFWTDQPYYDETKQRLQRVPNLLGGTGASARAAELICEYV